MFLLLLCNDRQVLGPWVNARWLNLLAGFIVSVLLLLSGILMATTLSPHVDATHVGESLAVGLAIMAGLALLALKFTTRGRPASQPAPAMSKRDKLAWRMPQLSLLEPVAWSPGLKLGMLSLRGYLVAIALLLIVKAVQLGS